MFAYVWLRPFFSSKQTHLVTLQINADGVKRNFYPGDKLPLWHDELEPHNSLLDILAAGNPDLMVQ
jgi:20S proteasome subunit beta 1